MKERACVVSQPVFSSIMAKDACGRTLGLLATMYVKAGNRRGMLVPSWLPPNFLLFIQSGLQFLVWCYTHS